MKAATCERQGVPQLLNDFHKLIDDQETGKI